MNGYQFIILSILILAVIGNLHGIKKTLYDIFGILDDLKDEK